MRLGTGSFCVLQLISDQTIGGTTLTSSYFAFGNLFLYCNRRPHIEAILLWTYRESGAFEMNKS